jgi:periplasmic protein TonB
LPIIEFGDYAGLKKIHENIEYPLPARRAGIEGRVYIQFIVNEQGEVEDPEVLRGIGGGADEAAIEAVKEARFWPGISQGQPVRFKMAMFIEFRLYQ